MKRILAGLIVFYALGIILAGLLRLDFWLITAVAIIVFILARLTVRRRLLCSVLVLFLALLAGYLNFENSIQLSRCHLRNFVGYKNDLIYNVSGFVLGEPESKNGRDWFILRAQAIQIDQLKYRCCGELLVRTAGGQDLNYGDNLTLLGPLKRLSNFNQPGQGFAGFLARQGVYVTMSIKDPRQIKRRGGCGGIKLISCCLRWRGYLEQVIGRFLPDIPASVLSAMVLGQKRNIPWRIKNPMVESGTVHILVVSGFNVGIVAFMVNLLFKILRLPRKVRIILTAICLLIYCLLTGASNPVIRATVMGLVFLVAYFFKREPDIYNSLISAALFILAFNPRQLFDIGFQLSFISVLAIVYLYPKLKALFCLEACRIRILKFIAEGCLVSFSAWLGTAVIVAVNFRIFTPVAVLANILIVPLATLITLCGFTMALTGLVYPGLAHLFSLPTAALVTLLLNINAALVKLPFACIYL